METIEHVFRDCRWSRLFWYSSCLRINVTEEDIRSGMMLWIHKQKNLFPTEGFTLFLMFLWYIWYSRNTMVHNKTRIEAVECQQRAMKILLDYEEVNRRTQKLSLQSSPARWRPPEGHQIKANSDASIMKGRGTGYRAVLRDKNGNILAAQAWNEDNELCPELAEAIACRMGAHLATSMQVTDIVFETNCITLIQKLNSHE